MQTRRHRLALLASLALGAALISGCSWKASGCSGPLPDAAALVKQSAAVTKSVTSAHLVLTVTGKISGLPVKTLTGDLTTSPSTAAKGNAKLTVFGSDIDANFVVVDGDLYTNALNPGDPTMSDVGPAAQLYDPSSILAPDTGVANLLANFTNADAKPDKCESIAGQSAVRITGTVSADAVNKIAPPFAASQPVPSTMWIQETGDHQLVQVSLEKSPGNTVQMTLSTWGQPVQVTKPGAN